VDRAHRILGQLPAAYRTVLELRFLHSYSASEMAREIGISSGGTRMLQFRALRAAARIDSGEASSNRPQAVAESAGRAWGSYLTERPPPFTGVSADEAIARVVALFAELGFMPEAVADGAERKILLHRCPCSGRWPSQTSRWCAVSTSACSKAPWLRWALPWRPPVWILCRAHPLHRTLAPCRHAPLNRPSRQ
jgi:hypothetical protein